MRGRGGRVCMGGLADTPSLPVRLSMARNGVTPRDAVTGWVSWCRPRCGCVAVEVPRPSLLTPLAVNTLKGRVVKETATCEHLQTTAQRLLLLALSPAHFASPVL
ncbi:hypothetical protein E2C01_006488 [Portunus trituberculatus]|uniref:Uncharacterized protein n=1 Tax=Portunus trituberculatus TaxID=210409 RepID=A0A5B7CYB5_PORTR|nr:hypothetical protein [Portunus trituberculatus]